MSTFLMAGVTHHRAGLELLERVSVPAGARSGLLAALTAAGCAEAAVLTTCSRTEVYAITHRDGAQASDVADDVLAVLAAQTGLDRRTLITAADIRTGDAAVHHLFRVACGLDSRMPGEVEVRSQVRAAARDASGPGELRRAFSAGLRAASRVHEFSGLGGYRRSLGRRAVQAGLAASGAAPRAMIVGSGTMAGMVHDELARHGASSVMVARNPRAAAQLLRPPSRAVPFAELPAWLATADLVICAASAPHRLVTHGHVTGAIATRPDRPLTIVDMSVPRAVDDSVARLPGVRLLDLDDLHDDPAGDDGLRASLAAAQSRAAAEAEDFLADRRARSAGPLIARMRQQVEDLCAERLRAAAGGRSPIAACDVQRAARAIAGALLHPPTVEARRAAARGDVDTLQLLHRLFRVEPRLDGPCPADPGT